MGFVGGVKKGEENISFNSKTESRQKVFMNKHPLVRRDTTGPRNWDTFTPYPSGTLVHGSLHTVRGTGRDPVSATGVGSKNLEPYPTDPSVLFRGRSQ